MLPRRLLTDISSSIRRTTQGAQQSVTRDARKWKTAKELPRNASAKSGCLRPFPVKKQGSNSKSGQTGTKKRAAVQLQRPAAMNPFRLSPPAGNGNGRFLSLVPPAVSAACETDQLPHKRVPRNRRRSIVAEFRFQTFKKCFYTKCSTVLVPGDFRPCSPRRMFCSLECFEAHWKEKLYAHGPAAERKNGATAKAVFAGWKLKPNGKKPERAHKIPRAGRVAQFPFGQKTKNGWRHQGLLRDAAGL